MRSVTFSQVVLTQPVNGMLVELTRTRGDPVLFLKNKDMGAVPGGLPTVADYTEFADSDGFRRSVHSGTERMGKLMHAEGSTVLARRVQRVRVEVLSVAVGAGSAAVTTTTTGSWART